MDQSNTMFEKFLKRTNLQTHPYQVNGVNFCIRNEMQGHNINGQIIRGGIIADEMGLGKTIQMLGTIVSHWVPKTLIVVPRALLEQWEAVIIKTLGHHPLVYHGSNKKSLTAALQTRPIVLTTYGLISAGPSKSKKKSKKISASIEKLSVIHGIKWNRIIYDEAHHLRNKSTRIYFGALKMLTDYCWLVTGTPIQNRKTDFYNLCNVLKIPPSYYKNIENLPDLVDAFILRRTKASVGLLLPQLNNHTISVDWETEEEMDLGENIHALVQFSKVVPKHINATIGALSDSTLPMLIRARQICVYPPLIRQVVHRMSASGLVEEDYETDLALLCSSKINQVIKDILDRQHNGRSKLVFCHFRGEIDIIESRLLRNEMKVLKFDGRTSENTRDDVLNEPCDVLIIQIQTGCEGLNLQHFKEIYFVSPHWNPAVEDQAIARSHRIGQTEYVDVFKYSMAGFGDDKSSLSLDEYAARVQEVKRGVMTIFDNIEPVEDN